MKKLLFILALIVLFSCQKEKEAVFCWSCMVTTTTTFTGGSSSLGSPQTRCNMSTREMELFEQGSSSGNTITRATCTKQ